MIGVAVVGYGYWGPNLVRNFLELPEVRLVGVCDTDTRRLELSRARHPSLLTWNRFEDLLAHPHVDAVAIATSVASHFSLANAALRAGKHVFVEKPLTANSGDALTLITEAERRRLVLMVDHTFLYTPAVRKIRELMDTRVLGDLYYFDSVRVNLGLFRHDANVLWDLAVHDLAIMDYLLQRSPVAVSAHGRAHIAGELVNQAYLTFSFGDSLLAHIHVNWLAPVKVRNTLLCGDRKMVIYNDLESDDKIRVYDKGITLTNSPADVRGLRVNYRIGEMSAPHLAMTEALRTELAHFVDCIARNATPLSNGWQGLRVIRWLEAAERSIAARGRPIELVPPETHR